MCSHYFHLGFPRDGKVALSRNITCFFVSDIVVRQLTDDLAHVQDVIEWCIKSDMYSLLSIVCVPLSCEVILSLYDVCQYALWNSKHQYHIPV